MSRVKKLLGTLLGGVTAGAVITVFAAFGLPLDPATASSIAVGLAALGTYLAPANKTGPVTSKRRDDL